MDVIEIASTYTCIYEESTGHYVAISDVTANYTVPSQLSVIMHYLDAWVCAHVHYIEYETVFVMLVNKNKPTVSLVSRHVFFGATE